MYGYTVIKTHIYERVYESGSCPGRLHDSRKQSSLFPPHSCQLPPSMMSSLLETIALATFLRADSQISVAVVLEIFI
jgi:hypothetical protein